MDAKRIAQLLAHGAHALRAPEDEANKEGEAFAQEVWPTSITRIKSYQGPGNISFQAAKSVVLFCHCIWIQQLDLDCLTAES